ncbi:hypothetical protein [uncultured Vibrio sp.]|uniref:hypothetical protein n=1 Tax=uncultured Vibrio sp. TaxID=114054 RepID=UPI002AA7E54F|nr:hypothetical protein [uncultured Vibrio sp.]
MRLAHAVRVGSWVLVGLNLLMAVGAIAVFSRMAPAIEVILDRNERTLQACENMLSILALVDNGSRFSPHEERAFRKAFIRAKDNVTEEQEPLALEQIENNLQQLFAGDRLTRRRSVEAILSLGQINRHAMIVADQHAQHLGRNGAWGVAFMAISAFFAGVLFIRGLTKRVVTPLEEIHTVMNAHRNGDTMRRCTGVDLAQDVSLVFTGINEMLDQQTTGTSSPTRHPLSPAPADPIAEKISPGTDQSGNPA